MSDKGLILTLAKVIIAAAWADGDMALDEINSLKDLLFQLPHAGLERVMQITEREWAMLNMYIESPVDAAERARLVAQLQAALRTSKDQALALSALEDLIQADGKVTDEERVVVDEIKTAIEAAEVGIMGQLGRLVRGAVQRRSQVVANAPNREEYFEDFVKNKVYYAVCRRLNLSKAELHIPETDLRKLSLAGGLMGRVAHVDREVTDDEIEAMVNALQAGWGIALEAAALVAEVAVSEISAGLDYFRLTREFCTATTEDERLHLLDALFAVAAADGLASHNQIEELRRIAKSLQLTHTQFIDAKLKIPRERRAS